MSNKLIIANWKDYLDHNGIKNFPFHQINGQHLIIAPATSYLGLIRAKFPHLSLAAQDISAVSPNLGAFTGEITAENLKNLGIGYVMIGHSERRILCNENNELIKAKLNNAIKYNITPIICVGENYLERQNNQYKDVISRQLDSLDIAHIKQNIIIAYEPVWSIGSGEAASMSQIEEIMIHIKSSLRIAGNLILVYGGSVNAQNISEISHIESLDGVLVGKASTDFEQLRLIENIVRQI